jgi:hypothetical protein
VNRHVDRKNMAHFFTKAAEMRGKKEVAVNTRDFPEGSGRHERLDPAETGDVPAVLNNGMKPLRLCCPRHEITRLIKALRHRLFSQNLATMSKSEGDQTISSSRHGHIEKNVGGASHPRYALRHCQSSPPGCRTIPQQSRLA